MVFDPRNPGVSTPTGAEWLTWNPSNYFKATQGSGVGGFASRIATGAAPTFSELQGGWNGIMGKAEFDPSGYRLDQSQANTERDLALGSRGGQELLGRQLQFQIRGNGPTVAGLQAQQGQARALASSATQAANARGVSRALALRSATYAGQLGQQEANRDAALLRASEQIGAMGQYGQLQSQQRAGDIQSRQVSLDAEKANQQAELQRQGYQTQLANENAARKQKGYGSVLSAAGSVIGALSDIRAKEDISPAGMSFAERMSSQRKADELELQRRAEAESNARIEAALAGSNAGYGAQRAGEQANAAQGIQPYQPQEQSSGMAGMLGGAMSQFGGGLMSDQKSKDRIRFLEGELYGRKERELDPQNPYNPDYLSEAQRNIENGFDSRQALRGVRPYSFRYRPIYAEMMAEQSAGMAPPEQKPAAAQAAYWDARTPREGVMAQDLEKTPQGARVVESTPVGKVLDMKRSVAFALANAADMNRRISRLEGKRNDS